MLGLWEVGDDLSQAGFQIRRGKVTNQRKGFHTETMSFLQIFKKFEIFGFPIFWRMLFKPKMEIIWFLHSKCVGKRVSKLGFKRNQSVDSPVLPRKMCFFSSGPKTAWGSNQYSSFSIRLIHNRILDKPTKKMCPQSPVFFRRMQ